MPIRPGAYDDWYKRARWKRLARHQLQQQPLCEFHLARGHPVPAEIGDHKIPWRTLPGDPWTNFIMTASTPGGLQSLCIACHNGAKHRLEHLGRGFNYSCDLDGNPTDPAHFNHSSQVNKPLPQRPRLPPCDPRYAKHTDVDRD